MRSLSGQKETDAAAQGGRHHGYGGAGIFRPQTHWQKRLRKEEKPVIRPAASPAVRPQTETVRGQQAKTVHRPQTGAMHRPQAETVRGQQDMATSPAPEGSVRDRRNQSVPVCIQDDPGEYQSARPGARKGKSCGPVGKKSRSYVEMASMYGLMWITPVAPDIIRVSFVKGVTEKLQLRAGWPKRRKRFHGAPGESKALLRLPRVRLRCG